MKIKYAFIKTLGNLLLLLSLFVTPVTAIAADRSAGAAVQATELQGELTKGYSAHYLAVAPTQRDGTITLTLKIEAKVNTRAASQVNLWVLSPEGLRQLQGGERPEHIAIAAGNPTVLDADAEAEAFYSKEATFKASGRQTYTVIVYNRAPVAVNYTLAATNGTLTDASGQTKPVAAGAQAEPSRPTAAATPTVGQSQPAAQTPAQPKPTNTPSTSGDDEGGGDE
ncbi:MAG: hypothetical protein U0350_18660 [Caldilineaceae bacterium]